MIKNFLKIAFKNLLSELLNIFSKLIDIFNLKFHFKSLRIVKRIEGAVKHDGRYLAVFVIYQKNNLPFYIANVLKQCEDLGIDCVVSVNRDVDSSTIDFLKNNCHTLFVRENFGRDICAYKDCISEINLEKAEKLILLNDSLIYFSLGLDKVFKKMLDKKHDLVALNESYSNTWHIQTHFLSLSSRVFGAPSFSSFWKKYKPYNSRKHSIVKGEIQFSKDVLSRFQYDRFVFYSFSHILSLPELLKPQKEYISSLVELSPSIISEFKLISKIKRFPLYEFLARLENMNPSHSLAFIAPFITNTCVVKRDIVFRGSFTIFQVHDALAKIGVDSEELKFAISEMIFKGKVSEMSFLKKFNASLGII